VRRTAALALIVMLAAVSPPPAVSDDSPPLKKSTNLKNTLRWTTASEIENFGFDVHRGPTREGPWTRITPRPIRGAGTSDTLHRYTFVDERIEAGRGYWYWVESISFTNARKRYSPLIYAPPKKRSAAVTRRRGARAAP
jgi:hypothetical protein